MKLRTKYILFVVIIHLITLLLSWLIFKDNKVLFLLSEGFIILSIVIAIQLYRQLLQPMQLLLQGVDAIRERDFNIKFRHTGKYEMDELIAVYNDMIDQLRGERTRQEQQHFFLEKLIHTSPTGILILDYDNMIHEINPRALKLLGIPEQQLLKQPLQKFDHPILNSIQQLESGEAKTITYQGINTYKIQKSHFIDRGFARHFVMIEELTTEILAAEKKAYGKVIRMMAHEVNNTIGPVNSILQSTLSQKNLWSSKDNQLKEALQVAYDRNNNLNIFMRNFADVVKLPPPSKKIIDLHTLIGSTTQLMRPMAEENNIQFKYELAENPVMIEADRQQLEQVIINIIKNAFEAIQNSGIITFTSHTNPKQLIISDTGPGLSSLSEEQLFSPFFSTKKDGQGIGLTLVKDILVNHGFSFRLHTQKPGDTQFEIKFQ